MKLPKTILMYPMTLVSQAAHIAMRFQQNLAELVIKGDNTLETIFPPKDEKPEWATFDEDLPEAIEGTPAAPGPADGGASDSDRRTEGRFALYSVSEAPGPGPAGASTKTRQSKTSTAVPQPAVVAELDYSVLTLAQLRARLQSLSLDELEILLAYEQATKARAPFQTLLANRITRANAK